jgi:hypothetical protein
MMNNDTKGEHGIRTSEQSISPQHGFLKFCFYQHSTLEPWQLIHIHGKAGAVQVVPLLQMLFPGVVTSKTYTRMANLPVTRWLLCDRYKTYSDMLTLQMTTTVAFGTVAEKIRLLLGEDLRAILNVVKELRNGVEAWSEVVCGMCGTLGERDYNHFWQHFCPFSLVGASGRFEIPAGIFHVS